MEDCYQRNRYLSIDKRQTLANQLAIPEQCVSDYFKNLRSRKKHEERMKCLLKGLEGGDKQLDTTDSGAERSFENGLNNQLPSCSKHLSPVTASTSAGDSILRVHLPSSSRQCGRRYNVTPAVMPSTFQVPRVKNVCETDIVASKIAALTQSQKSSNKQSQSGNPQMPGTFKTSADIHEQGTVIPISGHRIVQQGLKHDTKHLVSPSSPSGVDTVETFTLDSLIDGSMMLPGGTPETESLDIGQQIYVVHVNTHMETRVQN